MKGYTSSHQLLCIKNKAFKHSNSHAFSVLTGKLFHELFVKIIEECRVVQCGVVNSVGSIRV